MKGKHIWLISAALVLILVSGVCLLTHLRANQVADPTGIQQPSSTENRPQELMQMQMYAMRTDKDGGARKDLGTITVNIVKEVRPNEEARLDITLELPETIGFRVRKYESGSLIHDYSNLGIKDDYTITNVPCMRSTDGKTGFAWVAFDAEAGLFIMSDPFLEDSYIVASTEETFEGADILAYFPIIPEIS